tara:strand:+ start:33 stop:554 length:522 start_codon:yes stop_codon:yes gene_type:complete
MQTFFIYTLGLIFGLVFPDFDYFFERFIGHRSIFTHSILIVLIFLYLTKNLKDLKTSYYVAGLLNGIIIHLISDINLPSNITNIQTIKFFIYDLRGFSFYWILINVLIGLYLSGKFDVSIYQKRIELLNLSIFIVFTYFTSDIYQYLTVIYICLKILFFLLNKKNTHFLKKNS